MNFVLNQVSGWVFGLILSLQGQTLVHESGFWSAMFPAQPCSLQHFRSSYLRFPTHNMRLKIIFSSQRNRLRCSWKTAGHEVHWGQKNQSLTLARLRVFEEKRRIIEVTETSSLSSKAQSSEKLKNQKPALENMIYS